MVCNWVIARFTVAMQTTLSTTEEFTASATPRGPPLASVPRKHEITATMAAKISDLPSVNHTSVTDANVPKDCQKLPVVTPLTPTASMNDAATADAQHGRDNL